MKTQLLGLDFTKAYFCLFLAELKFARTKKSYFEIGLLTHDLLD